MSDGKRKRGPKSATKKPPDYLAKALRFAHLGLSQKRIADLLHIHPTTLIRWKHSDANFANAIALGSAKLQAEKLAQISKAARKDWRAAAWLIEKRFPGEFTTRTEMTGPAGGPIQEENRLIIHVDRSELPEPK